MPNHDGPLLGSGDQVRLNKQQERVWGVMKDGLFRTIEQIELKTGDPAASISARLRDFRKPKFGGFTVDRKYLGDGLYAYRVMDAA